MTLIIEDTARNNLVSWTLEAVNRGAAVTGAVISPFSTPHATRGFKQTAEQTIDRLRAEDIEVWVDPETHALHMPNVGDFRYYEEWPLWSGTRGALGNEAQMRDHVERVFEVQDELGTPHLAPTILLHSSQSPESQVALELAEVANGVDPDARLAVAGDSAFWASRTLDGHIGALAQLEPPGWFLTTVRSFTLLPVPATEEEVHGLCRTSRALGEDAEVHISHGDLAGLPAMAAGATTLGTGWDPRQRVSAYASYAARTDGSDGGQWFQQVTYDGLLSLVARREASLFAQQQPQLAARLHPGTLLPGAKEGFLHHADVLGGLVEVLTQADEQDAYDELRRRYDAALQDWPAAAAAIGITSRANSWLGATSGGLGLYAQTEGL